MKITECFNMGIIYALLGLSFYICTYKFKFINLVQGVCFVLSGICSTWLFYSNQNTLFVSIIIPLSICIFLGIINAILVKIGIEKILSNILTLTISIITFYLIPFNKISASANLTLPLNQSFFLLFLIAVGAILVTFVILHKTSSILNSIFAFSFANFLSGMAGILYLAHEKQTNTDYVFSIILSCTIFLIMKVFAINCKKISIHLILIVTSSILLSELASIFKSWNWIENKIYFCALMLASCICYLWYKKQSLSIFTPLSYKTDECDNLQVNVSQKTSETLINAIKSQYI